MSTTIARKELTGWTPVGKATTSPRASLFIGLILCVVTVFAFALPESRAVIPFALIFLLVGLSMVWSGISQARRLSEMEGAHARQPDTPWLWDHAWHHEIIHDRTAGTWKTAVAVAFVVLLFLVPFNALFLRENKDAGSLLFMAIFDAAGMAAIGFAIYLTARRLKYGVTRVRLGKFPFRPGEEIQLQMSGGPWLSTSDNITATLRCVEEHVETRGSGKNRKRVIVAYELYRDSVDYDEGALRRLELRELPVRFNIPADAPGTTLHPGPIRYWDLEIEACVPGVDYKGHFLIPLYGA